MRDSARQRLLDAADQLFYAEGVRSVGIDRVIAQAGVAKASLYSTFGSKDELIRAYLMGRHEVRQARVNRFLERCETPRERILAVYEALEEAVGEPAYRGCPFANAIAESPPGGVAEQVAELSRAWLRGLFQELADQAGVAEPERLAAQLVLLYDGAVTGARLDRDPARVRVARTTADALLAASGA